MTQFHYPYLIIGGGMTADAAVRGIREIDSESPIGLIGAETHPPYNRPPLSKGLWSGQPTEDIWRATEEQGVTMHLGRTAEVLDPTTRTVTDDTGTVYTFDRLLLATGGIPRRLRPDGDAVHYFRTLDDYRRLRRLADENRRVVVIGGGFIGSELAAALATHGNEVTLIFPGAGIGRRIFPEDLSRFLDHYYRERGIDVRPLERIEKAEKAGRKVRLTTHAGETLTADVVVAGLGVTPNTALAEAAGLRVDGGVTVDEYLRASHPDIFAAGDVARFYQPALDLYLRVEHEDNANAMGVRAGRNMAGEHAPYQHLPFFYSDLFDLGYEAVGIVDARLDTVSDWQEPYRKGVIYYLENARVRGVLLWNTWGKLDEARALIAEPGPFRPADLARRPTTAIPGTANPSTAIPGPERTGNP